MWFLTFFGLLMMALSLLMIKNPQAFSAGIITFSQKSYFHIFEIFSRLFFGAAFIYYSPLSLAPNINAILGYLMIVAALMLLIIGAEKHRAFALWSAKKFRAMFRYCGFFSFLFGCYIIYSTI